MQEAHLALLEAHPSALQVAQVIHAMQIELPHAHCFCSPVARHTPGRTRTGTPSMSGMGGEGQSDTVCRTNRTVLIMNPNRFSQMSRCDRLWLNSTACSLQLPDQEVCSCVLVHDFFCFSCLHSFDVPRAIACCARLFVSSSANAISKSLNASSRVRTHAQPVFIGSCISNKVLNANASRIIRL